MRMLWDQKVSEDLLEVMPNRLIKMCISLAIGDWDFHQPWKYDVE